VRFVTEGEPLWVVYCHCQSCRHHTASPVAAFAGFRREQVTFATADRSIYPSSPGVWRGFCARCGTPLSYESERSAGELHLYLGNFDAPEGLVPQGHVYFAERLTGFEVHDAMPRFALGGSSEPMGWGPLHSGKSDAG
jgi:hypothetical protein